MLNSPKCIIRYNLLQKNAKILKNIFSLLLYLQILLHFWHLGDEPIRCKNFNQNDSKLWVEVF